MHTSLNLILSSGNGRCELAKQTPALAAVSINFLIDKTLESAKTK